MANIDVFNGDADGICSLVQLRNAYPRSSRLVTGVKRDIQLLEKIDARSGDEITVLDVSLEENRAGLITALGNGAQVFYVDHHFAGQIPEHAHLTTLINTSADVCTSLLVNTYLEGQYKEWAIAGAFGDNLKKSARLLAKSTALSESQVEILEKLGTYMNYNGYGAAVEDLHFPPAELFERVRCYTSPLDFVADESAGFAQLEAGYLEDMSLARSVVPELESDRVAVYLLPDAAWSRRVSGVFGNDLANEAPARAHAVVTRREAGGYLISVRAPLENKVGADEVCRQFPTGGGRQAAAGINNLPEEQLPQFIKQLADYYAGHH